MLEKFLIHEIFTFFIIFCRIGAAITLLPGLGESYVSARIRLIIALAISFILMPLLASQIPSIPESLLSLTLMITGEIVVGLFIGTVCKILISVTHVAGMIISLQMGISSAVIFDPNQSSQGSLIGNMFGLMTILLLFATDMHLVMLRGVTESYSIFAVGKYPPLHDFAMTIAHLTADSFTMAVQISAPFIVTGTLLFLAAGIIGRLMPTLQVFGILAAPQLLLGFSLLISISSAMMLYYMEFYREKIAFVFGYL